MKMLTSLVSDKERPIIVTIIAGIGILFAILTLLQTLWFLIKHPEFLSGDLFLAPGIMLLLGYFLLKGSNWARMIFAFFCSLSVMYNIIAMINGIFSTSGIIVREFSIIRVGMLAYLIFVFVVMTSNKKVLSYFKRNKVLNTKRNNSESNHGLESTGAPPAAGTPETHP